MLFRFQEVQNQLSEINEIAARLWLENEQLKENISAAEMAALEERQEPWNEDASLHVYQQYKALRRKEKKVSEVRSLKL